MSKIKNGGLDQYGAEPFEQQQFGTAGVEGVNNRGRRLHVGQTVPLKSPVTARRPVTVARGRLGRPLTLTNYFCLAVPSFTNCHRV